MSRSLFIAASILAVPLLSACTTDSSELTEVLPDERVLVSLDTEGAEAMARSSSGEWSEFYLQTARTTEEVNGMIGGVLHLVDSVVDLRPSRVDRRQHLAVWGPYSDSLDPVETTLTVQYHPETDTHTWIFRQWPKGRPEAAVDVVTGEVDPGATRLQSSGRFLVDFTAISDLDPSQTTAGTFLSEYEIAPDGVTAAAIFQGMDEQTDDQPPVDAGYLYEQTADGEGAMDLAWLGDEGGDGSLETYVLRSRWLPTGEGRGDAVLRGEGGGPLGAASECWDDRFQLVYQAQSWAGEAGDPTRCAFEAPEYSEE